jgi:hypothetical protein
MPTLSPVSPSAIPPTSVPARVGDSPGIARLAATARADAAAGSTLDVTVGADPRAAAPPADGPARQLPLVTASAHGVAAKASADELGKPDFGKALRRWLDLERDRMFGELSNLDQVHAVARAYAEREQPVPRAVEPAEAPPSERDATRATEPALQGGLRLVR